MIKGEDITVVFKPDEKVTGSHVSKTRRIRFLQSGRVLKDGRVKCVYGLRRFKDETN